MSRSRDEIAIVIPAHGAARTIRRAIDSVLQQPQIEPTIFVIVDGQTDGTHEELAAYSYERIHILTNSEAKGAARARNRGLGLVQSPFVMFLDADDWIEGPLLTDLAHRMITASADLGFGPMDILNEQTGRRNSTLLRDFTSSEDLLWGWHAGERYVGTCSILWRTDFLRSVGGWDPNLTRNDDGELVLRAILKGAQFVHGRRGCGVYVKHGRETLSNRADNLGSQVVANEKLLAIQSSVVDRRIHIHSCAAHFYKIAWQCFYFGEDEMGRGALQRSRSLGFKGALGPLPFRIASKCLGLRSAARLASLRRRLIGNAAVLTRWHQLHH